MNITLMEELAIIGQDLSILRSGRKGGEGDQNYDDVSLVIFSIQ